MFDLATLLKIAVAALMNAVSVGGTIYMTSGDGHAALAGAGAAAVAGGLSYVKQAPVPAK